MKLESVPDVPEVREGDDLAAMVEARFDLEPADVLVVASTVVSKAEGRVADLEAFPASDRARDIAGRLESITGDEKDPRFAQAVLEESTELLMEAPFLLAKTHFGHVGVNAGIDRSNVPGGDVLLLPEDPDASAARIHEGLTHENPVVVTDTSGRPFRHGQTGVAVGYAGMPASRDYRGERDRDGHELAVTVECVVDELAAAANLLAGEADAGRPFTVVRDWSFGDHAGSDNLFRGPDGDFVREALQGWTYDA
jgi:coenzyme F420-0:L-glutamate ligase/coenzyme F420-1:gamma-L-glutamate ligase